MTKVAVAMLIRQGRVVRQWQVDDWVTFHLVELDNEGLHEDVRLRFAGLFRGKRLAVLDFSSAAMFLISSAIVGGLRRCGRFGRQMTRAQHSAQCFTTTMDVASLA